MIWAKVYTMGRDEALTAHFETPVPVPARLPPTRSEGAFSSHYSRSFSRQHEPTHCVDPPRVIISHPGLGGCHMTRAATFISIACMCLLSLTSVMAQTT